MHWTRGPDSASSVIAANSRDWFFHQAELSGIFAGMTLPNVRVKLSACPVAFCCPRPRTWFEKKSFRLIIASSCQNAQREFLRNHDCIAKALLRHMRIGWPEPGSANALPVP